MIYYFPLFSKLSAPLILHAFKHKETPTNWSCVLCFFWTQGPHVTFGPFPSLHSPFLRGGKGCFGNNRRQQFPIFQVLKKLSQDFSLLSGFLRLWGHRNSNFLAQDICLAFLSPIKRQKITTSIGMIHPKDEQHTIASTASSASPGEKCNHAKSEAQCSPHFELVAEVQTFLPEPYEGKVPISWYVDLTFQHTLPS